MKNACLSLLLFLPLANVALAQAPAAGTSADTKLFECKEDGLKVELALRSGDTGPAIATLRTNGRDTDPTTFNYVNSLAEGRVIERVESSCKDKSLELVMHLAPVPSDKRETVTVTAWATTVKVH